MQLVVSELALNTGDRHLAVFRALRDAAGLTAAVARRGCRA